MARRKAYEKIDINVEPFLSIMAIVLKLISLILVVIVMRIALNPRLKRIVSIIPSDSCEASRGNLEDMKVPSWVDCHPNEIVLYPGEIKVTYEDLSHPGNALEVMLDRVQSKKDEEFVVVMARPKSVKLYRAVRNLIAKRPIDLGCEVVDADFKVNWSLAEENLGIGSIKTNKSIKAQEKEVTNGKAEEKR